MEDKEQFNPASFGEAIRICIAPIDDHLADLHVPIPDRVLQAACIFVEHCVVDIKGDSKDDFISKSWFQFVFRTTRSWYEEKYGPALKLPEAFLVGACEIAGAFFEIRVPVILRRPGKPGETIWIVFPIDLQPEEDLVMWFPAPPNFEALEDTSRTNALEDAAEVGRLRRAIHSGLMTTKRPDDISRALADMIQSQLSTSAEHLTRAHKPMFGLAVWECHKAVESALKLLNRQFTGDHPYSHSLVFLFEKISDSVSGIDQQMLGSMPSHKRVIEIREGEGLPITAEDAYRIYRTALSLAAQLTAAMPRDIVMRNAALHIGRAPFI